MSRQFTDIFTQLESWYATDRGQYVLMQARELLQTRLDTAFGYHILQLSPLRGVDLIAGSRINHRIYGGTFHGDHVGLLCEPDELPLESDSVDVVVAQHSLELADNPHQVLREIQRILTPQGHLLLIGFNPFSFRGLNTRVRGLSRKSVWHGYSPVGHSRLTDWLHLLGCEVRGTSFLYCVPPVGRGRIREWLEHCDCWCGKHNLPLGGLYVVHAVKQVAALNRPRNALRRRRERLIGLVPKPGTAPTPTPSSPVRAPGVTSVGCRGSGDAAA